MKIYNLKKTDMKKFLIIIQHFNYQERWATTNNKKTAIKYAIQAILDNKGKLVKIL